MKSEIITSTKIILELDREEADWLMELVQNPLKDDETDDDSKMRYELWNALSGDVWKSNLYPEKKLGRSVIIHRGF